MALGGGTWITQNKIIPGTYINFVSMAKSSASLSDRGTAAAPFVLDWGKEGAVFAVTAAEFQKDSRKIFGYSYDADELINVREIFNGGASKVYCYRLGTGTAATNTYATAKYAGTRGNALTIRIASNVDNVGYYDVETYLDGEIVDSQLVNSASALVANDFVTFKSFSIAETATSGSPLSGGANCASITGTHFQAFLTAIESYSFHVLCCPVASTETTTISLFVNFTKRLRDDIGSKFQCVIPFISTADYEGCIGIGNTATFKGYNANTSLLYWVAGAEASAAVNKSLTNAKYNGELTINTAYTQAQLEASILAGKLMFHDVNGETRVLEDIDTLVTMTEEKGDVFQSNQTVRVCDQIANEVAVLFNTRYLGKIPNDASGRAALWNDIVALIRLLEKLRAVEDFDEESVSVEQGSEKNAVLLTISGLNIVNAMSRLYMSIIVK